MIPVTVLTGFLGSGKTTLLARLLQRPELARTAVIINEFGEIGLDHELIAASEESVVELETGCLCCVVRGDLALTLADLLVRRDRGEVAPFNRIIIETSGLADPAPILQLLMTDHGLAERIALAGVVTTIDAVTALATLDREPLSLKQAAIADKLVITKTDLLIEDTPVPLDLRRSQAIPLTSEEGPEVAKRHPGSELDARLRAINPTAPRLIARLGEVDVETLLADQDSRDTLRWLAAPPDTRTPPDTPLHHGIETFTIIRTTPIPAIALTLFLETLAEHCGRDLLRMKGILAIAESPDRPAVIHGVQHVFHPPAFLDRWPSDDRRSRLVFIVRSIPRGWIEALLDAIESEVADVTRAS